MDIRGLMRRAVNFNSEREAIVHGERRLTFAQSWQRGLRLANALLGMGLKPGDRVGSLEDNGIAAVDFFLAATIANLVRVPLYPRNSAETHGHMLGHTVCRAVIAASEYVSELDGLLEALPKLEKIICRDDGYENWLAGFPDDDPDVPVAPDDYFIVRHTGGTTGLPKGVAYTHRAWLAAGRDWTFLFPPIEPGDKCLHIAPISHGSGYLFVPMWLSGACNVLLDHFDAGAALACIEAEPIQYLFVVPAMLNLMNRDPKARSRDFSKLKCMQVGAAPIADDTALTAREIFGDTLWQGYGQTEAVPVTMMGPRQWFAEIEGSEPLRSCGLVLPFADVEIWDENNKPLAQGEEGEIALRCDGQMAGFWDDPEATAERMVDGWVLTGDIGMIDRNGYLYLLDRAGDMIVSGGENIAGSEVERVLYEHEAVLEAAVVGRPDDRWGEVPVAFVVPADPSLTADELMDLCRENLSSYKRPKDIFFLTDEELPRSTTGKVQRHELEARLPS